MPFMQVIPPTQQFLSTPSARRATESKVIWHSIEKISIHALREEGDRLCLLHLCVWQDFYPRPPRGGRLSSYHKAKGDDVISIHALREEGDANIAALGRVGRIISIHALREEGDPLLLSR